MGRRGVTFDLDNTLAVVRRDRTEILNAAAQDVGIQSLSRERYLRAHRRHHANFSREPIFAAVLREAGHSDANPAALAAAYRRRIGEAIEPVEGVDRMLDRIQTERPAGLVTNGPILAQQDKLERLGWTERFDTVVISGAIGQAKPAAEPFHEACARMRTDPDRTVHVGDDPIADVQGATDAGLGAILVGGADETPAAVRSIDRRRLVSELPRALKLSKPA